MFKLTLLALLATTGVFQLAVGSPTPLTLTPIRRESNEGVYLSNCDEFEPGKLFSEMDYYANAKSGSQNGQHPDASTVVDSSNYVIWEGQQVCGTFSSSGETFCSNINSDAASLVSRNEFVLGS